MSKNNNELVLYICSHKAFDMSKFHNDHKYCKEYYTNECDNKLNDMEFCYAEGYHIYNLYSNKNKLPNYIGIMQYRRLFDCKDNDILLKYLKEYNYDIVLPKHADFNNIDMSVYDHYMDAHNNKDMDLCIQIICKKYPEYIESMINTLGGTKFYYCNMFIMSKENFINYCKWIFSIFDEFNKIRKFKIYDDVEKYVSENKNNYGWIDNYPYKNSKYYDYFSSIKYNCRIHGFLMERLFNIYINHNFSKIAECPIIELPRE